MRRVAALVESRFAPVILLLLGAALRWRYVGTSLCMDDWASLRDSVHVLPGTVEKFRPLFFTILYSWRCLGPDTDGWLQLLPFLFSVATIPLAWLVGKRMGGAHVAATLALLFAISPTHLDLTAELRLYGLLSLLGLAQLLCYLEFRERPRTWLLVANALIGAVAMYAQPIYIVFLFGLFVLALLDHRQLRIKPYVLSLAAMAVLYLPNTILVLQYGQYVHAESHGFTTHASSALFKLIAAYTTGFTLFRVNDLGLGAKFGLKEMLANLPLVLMAAAAFLLIAYGAICQLRAPTERFTRLMLLALLVLPFAAAYGGVLVLHRDFTHAHYHITSLPVVLLFVIKGLQGLRAQRILHYTAVILYACVMGLSLYRFLFDGQHFGRRSDWVQAAHDMEQHISPQEPLLLFMEKPGRELDYPYLTRYAYQTHTAWLRVAAPGDTTKSSAYAEYLRRRLAGYNSVYYLWDAVAKNLLDPRNTVLTSMKSLASEESVEVINPRLAIYRWKVRE